MVRIKDKQVISSTEVFELDMETTNNTSVITEKVIYKSRKRGSHILGL